MDLQSERRGKVINYIIAKIYIFHISQLMMVLIYEIFGSEWNQKKSDVISFKSGKGMSIQINA